VEVLRPEHRDEVLVRLGHLARVELQDRQEGEDLLAGDAAVEAHLADAVLVEPEGISESRGSAERTALPSRRSSRSVTSRRR